LAITALYILILYRRGKRRISKGEIMKKLNILIISALITCIFTGLVTPVHASDGEEVLPQDIDEISSEELKELDELELVPVPVPGKEVSINGGFQGVWGTDISTEARPGKVAGLYGKVAYENDRSYGFFGGLWKDSNGRMAGYLKGRYRDGRFYGIWRCLETDMWGPVVGRYYPVPTTDSSEVCHHFVGRWATIDGQLTGFLRGTWAPLAQVKPEGKFNGQWIYDNDTTAATVAPDGKLSGSYGVAVFKDGTTIHYFRGRWTSQDGARGRLGGLVVDRTFCGIWNSDNHIPQGYLKGIWGHYRFKGVWGQFGQGTEGRLWGKYRPFPTLEPVEENPLPRELTASALVMK
jgi:hypothetical protein